MMLIFYSQLPRNLRLRSRNNTNINTSDCHMDIDARMHSTNGRPNVHDDTEMCQLWCQWRTCCRDAQQADHCRSSARNCHHIYYYAFVYIKCNCFLYSAASANWCFIEGCHGRLLCRCCCWSDDRRRCFF